jgi:hypothetical protein
MPGNGGEEGNGSQGQDVSILSPPGGHHESEQLWLIDTNSHEWNPVIDGHGHGHGQGRREHVVVGRASRRCM